MQVEIRIAVIFKSLWVRIHKNFFTYFYIQKPLFATRNAVTRHLYISIHITFQYLHSRIYLIMNVTFGLIFRNDAFITSHS
jgi:hypothetical protein